MAYLVLARKYRPQSFEDIVGQEHVVRTLKNAIALDRVHHAFLFTGARGVGKTTTARVLAKALGCDLSGPDVLEIDGASNTGVDNVRELRETVRYLPSQGQYKLYIIDEVHMLSQAAFNALLKTLEEPPPHVKFIFATTEPQKIPVTILSRCQRFDFRRVSVSMLIEHLKNILEKEQISISPGILGAVAREAQGSVRDALSLLDQVLSFAGDKPTDAEALEALGVVDRETIFSLASSVIERDATQLLELVARVDQRGHELADVAGHLLEHFRDLMVVKTAKKITEAMLDRSPGEIEQLQAQGRLIESPELHRVFSALVPVVEDIPRSHNQRVTFEMGMLRLLEIEPTASLGSLLERIDSVMTGASTASASAQKKKSLSPEFSGSVPSGSPSTAARPEQTPGAPSARSGQPEPKPVSVTQSAPAVESASDDESAPPSQSVPPVPVAAPGTWPAFVASIKSSRPALASVLEHGQVVEFGPEGVELAFEADTFYLEAANDSENRELLVARLEALFGKPTALKVSAGSPGSMNQAAPESIAAKTFRERGEREDRLREQALTDPTVERARAILGAEVKEVVPLMVDD